MYNKNVFLLYKIKLMEWRKINLSKDQLKEIDEKEKEIKNARVLKRIQCIKLKNSGWKHTEVKKFLQIRLETVSEWIKWYKEGGIEKLLQWQYKGKSSVLTTSEKEKIKKRVEEKPFDTAKEAKAYIKEEFGQDWHLHSVQKLLKKNFEFHTSNRG